MDVSSLQTSNSPRGSTNSKTILDLDASSNKRKWNDEGSLQSDDEGIFGKRFRKSPTKPPIFEIELQLETPLPLEWQRCLDIQSGQIHFYNTRTKKRTSMDPRKSKQEPQSGHMSLELELNLPCDSQRKNKTNIFGSSTMKDCSSNYNKEKNNKNNNLFELLGDEEKEEEEEEEMVAIVCERCHLLVMLCKSSPSCPNCKFMHSIDDHTFHNYYNKQFKPSTLLASCVSYL